MEKSPTLHITWPLTQYSLLYMQVHCLCCKLRGPACEVAKQMHVVYYLFDIDRRLKMLQSLTTLIPDPSDHVHT